MSTRLDKKKIFLLYQCYLTGKINETEEKEKNIIWFKNCWEKEKYLRERIATKLKTEWDFSRLPHLEKAILIYAVYEILFNQGINYSKLIINNVINFSKAYSGEEKYKYINKVLDLIAKEEKCVKK